MRKMTVFQNFTKVLGQRSLQQILSAIQKGVYKDAIEAIRRAVQRGDKSLFDDLKKQLQAFTVSGEFKGGRTLPHLQVYHPYLVLDIDKLRMDTLQRVKEVVPTLPFTRAAFLSPSGKGYKVIVEVDSEQEEHQIAFEQVVHFYEKKLKVKVDSSGKDITRLCFFSYDDTAFYNEVSQVYQVNKLKETSVFELPIEKKKHEIDLSGRQLGNTFSIKEKLERCLAYTQLKSSYIEGNRNNFIYLYVSNCNRFGIGEQDVLNFCLQRFDLGEVEMRQTIRSGYRHHVSEFGSKPLMVKKEDDKVHFGDSLRKTPVIPDKVYRLLPALLRQGCEVFDEERERDVFLIGALTVLSGMLTKVEGLYDGCKTYSNLFSFIVAPAASGKGVLKFAKQLGAAVHRRFLKENKDLTKDYEVDMIDYQIQVTEYKKRKRTTLPDTPEKPVRRLLFIPANSSSAMIIRQLKESGGCGVLCESEADTLGNVLKQDWGGYSDLLRKAFHFETISYSRKSNDEFYEIESPRMSVAISGTPNQILGLIPSTEDGLFSRFIFYAFSVKSKWKKQAIRRDKQDLSEYFSKQSDQVMKMVDWLAEHPTKVDMSFEQWKFFDEILENMLLETSSLDGEEVTSTVKRLGVILFRLVMVLSAMRKYESQKEEEKWIVHDDDFHVAMSLVETFWRHAILLFEHLPKNKKMMLAHLPNRKKLFFQKLPKVFKRSEAQVIGKEVGLKPRTVDKYLKLFLGKLLEQPEYGCYKKM